MANEGSIYRVTIANGDREYVSRMLKITGCSTIHADDICNKNGSNIYLTKEQVEKLKKLGFMIMRLK